MLYIIVPCDGTLGGRAEYAECSETDGETEYRDEPAFEAKSECSTGLCDLWWSLNSWGPLFCTSVGEGIRVGETICAGEAICAGEPVIEDGGPI